MPFETTRHLFAFTAKYVNIVTVSDCIPITNLLYTDQFGWLMTRSVHSLIFKRIHNLGHVEAAVLADGLTASLSVSHLLASSTASSGWWILSSSSRQVSARMPSWRCTSQSTSTTCLAKHLVGHSKDKGCYCSTDPGFSLHLSKKYC